MSEYRLIIFILIVLADVCELRGEWFGHMLDGPPVDTVEERTETVTSAQPSTFPETGGEWRTVTSQVCCCALKSPLWSMLVIEFNLCINNNVGNVCLGIRIVLSINMPVS